MLSRRSLQLLLSYVDAGLLNALGTTDRDSCKDPAPFLPMIAWLCQGASAPGFDDDEYEPESSRVGLQAIAAEELKSHGMLEWVWRG